MKFFLYGIGLGVLLLIIGAVTPFHLFFSGAAGIIAVVSLLISGIFSGTFVNGDQNRANYWTENQQERGQRAGISFRLFLFGSPLLAVCIILYAIYH
ncbi:DUF5316 domain-containing protein [Sporolactobacillus pectinivorans]|uniref:DUF5316 domain-containing protein n=1 Tax=Sporolactobacillus pectinivorans TaxID=1591408 RepID=UPI000C2596F9|nr:DUF5316 domain-containing protein [Sporolactobacillus pectinivorans]